VQDSDPTSAVPKNFPDLWSADRARQGTAFHEIIAITSRPVNWANDVWDEVVANLTHKDNHNRAIAAQVLCNLATSDASKRILHDFRTLFAVTGDERFVTARHCLQNFAHQLIDSETDLEYRRKYATLWRT